MDGVLEFDLFCGTCAALVHPLGADEWFLEIRGWDETIPSEFFPAEEWRPAAPDEVEAAFVKLTGVR